MGELAELASDLELLLEDNGPLQHSIGKFAKEAALDAATRDLGSDRAFSGFRRKVRLAAGYDLGTPVVLHLRPAGLWVLADKGRRGSGSIHPRRRRTGSGRKGRGRPAVKTPLGFRASSSYRTSRGHNTIRDVEKNIDQGIVEAAGKGLDDMIQKAGF